MLELALGSRFAFNAYAMLTAFRRMCIRLSGGEVGRFFFDDDAEHLRDIDSVVEKQAGTSGIDGGQGLPPIGEAPERVGMCGIDAEVISEDSHPKGREVAPLPFMSSYNKALPEKLSECGFTNRDGASTGTGCCRGGN